MQPHQAVEKALRLRSIGAEQCQPGLQLRQQFGDHRNQLGRLLQRHRALGAPDQVGHQRAETLRVDLVACVAQARMRHHQCPGAEQKVKHQTRHIAEITAPAQIECQAVSQCLPLFGKTQRLQRRLPLRCVKLVLLRPALFQQSQCLRKRLGVFDLQRVELIECLGDRLKKS